MRITKNTIGINPKNQIPVKECTRGTLYYVEDEIVMYLGVDKEGDHQFLCLNSRFLNDNFYWIKKGQKTTLGKVPAGITMTVTFEQE